jgi:hypothetical protein
MTANVEQEPGAFSGPRRDRPPRILPEPADPSSLRREEGRHVAMTLARFFTIPFYRNNDGLAPVRHFGDCMVCVVQEAQ